MGKLAIKKRRIKCVKAGAAEKGLTRGINILNLAYTIHESENDSVHK